MTQILIIIAPLLIIIFASALLQKFRKMGKEWFDVLNAFALEIGLPVLIFSSLAKAPLSFTEQAPLLISNSIFIVGSFVLTFLIGKILRFNIKMFRTLFVCLVLGNTAYLGIPVLTQVYGAGILPTASLIVAVYLFWMFTVGIGFLDFTIEKKDVFKKIFKNLIKSPLLIAVFLGIIVATFKIQLPDILVKSLDMVTASVTPTVLIVLGLFIGKSKIGKIIDWLPALLFSFVRLMILPAIFYFGVKFFGYSTHQFSASIIEAAMPLAITPFALAYKFGLSKDFIVRSIILSTILSVISLPFWISIV
jgi:predicted permease